MSALCRDSVCRSERSNVSLPGRWGCRRSISSVIGGFCTRAIFSGAPKEADEAALRAGYYDQAHCIADFNAFAGMTPREFVAAEKTAFFDIG